MIFSRRFPRLYLREEPKIETQSTIEVVWVRRAGRGDRNAWAALVETHRGGAQSLALRFLNSRDDAQDVVQESFVYAFLHLSTLRDAAAFGAWLKEIIRRKSADFRRNRATKAYAALPDGFAECVAAQPDAGRPADLLAELPPALRWTAELAFVHGYALLEIAAAERIPVNTVRSRIARARTLLRSSLGVASPKHKRKSHTKTMSAKLETLLSPAVAGLLFGAFPDAELLSVAEQPEPWMPFAVRLQIKDATGAERSLDVRRDITPDNLALLAALLRAGLPVATVVADPVSDGEGGTVALTETPRGENLLLWSLEGNIPHRIYSASTLAIAAIDRLHGVTDALLRNPVADTLPCRSLQTELDEIVARGGDWLNDSLFADAVSRLQTRLPQIADPLVYTNDLYLPNFLRVESGAVTEFVHPWGHFGDPLYGLTKVWTYDCYPFVRTGFVERYLWEKGASRSDFAPRLALRALWTLQREVPVVCPVEGYEYHDALTNYLRMAIPDI